MKGWNDPPTESVLAHSLDPNQQPSGTVGNGGGDSNPFRGYLLNKSGSHKRSHSSGGTFATTLNEATTQLSPLVGVTPSPNIFLTTSPPGESTYSPGIPQFDNNNAASNQSSEMSRVPLVPTFFIPNDPTNQRSPQIPPDLSPGSSSLFPPVYNQSSGFLSTGTASNNEYLRSASTGCLRDSQVLGAQYQTNVSSNSSVVTGNSTPLMVPNPSIQSPEGGFGRDAREREQSMAEVLAAKLSHMQLQGSNDDVNNLSSPSPSSYSPLLVRSQPNFDSPLSPPCAPSFYSPTGTYSPLRSMRGPHRATLQSATTSETSAIQSIQPTFSVQETPTKVSLLERIFTQNPANDSSQIEKLQSKVQLFQTDWNCNRLDDSLCLLTCKLVHCVLTQQTDLAMRCFIKISVEHSKQAVMWSMAFKKLIRYFESHPNSLEAIAQPSSD